MMPTAGQQQDATDELMRLMGEAPLGVDVSALRQAAGSPERFDQAWTILRRSDYVTEVLPWGRWALSLKGRAALEAQKAPTRGHVGPTMDFAALRQEYIASLPARREFVRERAQNAALARDEAQQTEQQALGRYLPVGALWAGWQVGPERDRTLTNVLAIYPKFTDRPDETVYIRVRVDQARDVLWLQASTGEPTEYVQPGEPEQRVRQVLRWLLVPALDETVPRLPMLEDLDEH